MKIKKVLAVLSASALAASMMAMSASAAEVSYPTYAPVTLDSSNDDTKMIQIDLAAFEGITDANIASVDFTIKPNNGAWDGGQGWFGGGMGIGIQTADAWVQVDPAGDGTDEISTGWAAAAVVDGTYTNNAYSFTFTLPEGSETPYMVLDEDEESETYGQMVNAGPLQIGYWWGACKVIDVTEITVNFDDGTSIPVIDADATETYNQAGYTAAMNEIAAKIAKAEREEAAANALKDLTDAMTSADIDAAVEEINAAADALANSSAALKQVEDAKTAIADLEAKLAAAEEAFAALQDGDTADTTAYEAAKKAVEDAKTNLAAAEKALNDAIASVNQTAADQIAEKDKEIAALKEQLAAAEEQADKDAAEIADLKAQIEALKAEKAELEAQLEEALKNQGTGTETPSTEDPSTETPSTEDPADDNKAPAADEDKVPATGIAVALGGIALAAAGVVATKKRK